MSYVKPYRNVFLIEGAQGAQIFSHLMNGKAAEEMQKSQSIGVNTVYFSLYCDGTTLSKYDSQTKNIMRVRFENIRGHRNAR